ncbi:MAG: MFS transporter [Planctomycetota bacterium]|nr:MFS transporter [Planctomycetota bacterium]
MPDSQSPEPLFADADRNVGLFVAFRVLFNARFYYPVFMVMLLDYGISVEEFALLNAVWAAAIVVLEVPSGALADLIGRRRLVVAGGALMVVEMLLLVLVPVPSVWVLPVLMANRVVSGAAEAFVSGADEALAFDSLAACGRAGEWPRVLERIMRVGGVVTIIGMVTGSLVYDPGVINGLARGVGLAGGFTGADTFRLPIWLTLASALGAFAAALAMREPPRTDASGATAATGLAAAFRQTAATARWIGTQPLVLLVIVAGVLIDLPIRQVLVVSSEIYAEIGVPPPAFGLVSAASALLGLAAAGPLRRLALGASARANGLVLAAFTLAGLTGLAAFVPVGGVVFVILLSTVLRMVVFLQSHYLNQLVDSGRRATVLSFRGLAVNVGYGLGCLGFAAATAVSARLVGEAACFRAVVGLLPWGFLLACVAFWAYALRVRPHRAALVQPGGFGQPRAPSA